MAEDLVNVFHRWQAKLDPETREVTFLVTTKYALDEAEVEQIDPHAEGEWTKVLILAFPEGNTAEVDGNAVTFADKPEFFDVTQLHKRYIPIDEFVRVITKMMTRINADLDKAAALEQLDSESEWSLL